MSKERWDIRKASRRLKKTLETQESSPHQPVSQTEPGLVWWRPNETHWLQDERLREKATGVLKHPIAAFSR